MPARVRVEDRECPLSTAMSYVGEWWTILILHDCFDGYTRFEPNVIALLAVSVPFVWVAGRALARIIRALKK